MENKDKSMDQILGEMKECSEKIVEATPRDYLKELEESPHFKIGYLRGMVRTALWMLYRGDIEGSKLHLENGLRTLKMEDTINEAKKV